MPHDHAPAAHAGFDADRAAHYDAQAAVALAGVEAMYELGASALASRIEEAAASLLFVGLGTGAELAPYRRFDVPGWRFTGVDPSDAMLAVARARLTAEGLLSRTHLHVGELRSLPPGPPFDGAQMLGVLHHVPQRRVHADAAADHQRRAGSKPQTHLAQMLGVLHHVPATERLALLREVSLRLRPGAPLVVGCRVGMDPALWEVELRRWRAHGLAREEVERRRQGAGAMHYLESEDELRGLFARSGLVEARPIFVSLQFKVFLVRREPPA
jgi:tRNA (cmo5U34)-methyltransferase